ncbi:MAG: pyrroloquinoline quinone biosynthesis peptide chaperone PqqD [Rhodospirillales bacterium]|nr:pyrroloquinoline quinone biosynthesis peptide chaperone PqqD [Rhodospirillales bacterium]
MQSRMLPVQPRLAAHTRLTFDRHRGRWVILAPERMIILDEAAFATVSRCTGHATVAELVADLSKTFEGDPVTIEADVKALLDDLVAKGVVR